MTNEDMTRAILEQENDRLQRELTDARALLSRPVGVTVQSPDAAALQKVVEYLPQLTFIATNLSHVSSAVNNINNAGPLARIATALEDIAASLEGAHAIKMPQDRLPKKNGPDTQSRKVNDQGGQSWFTTPPIIR